MLRQGWKRIFIHWLGKKFKNKCNSWHFYIYDNLNLFVVWQRLCLYITRPIWARRRYWGTGNSYHTHKQTYPLIPSCTVSVCVLYMLFFFSHLCGRRYVADKQTNMSRGSVRVNAFIMCMYRCRCVRVPTVFPLEQLPAWAKCRAELQNKRNRETYDDLLYPSEWKKTKGAFNIPLFRNE